MRRGHWLQRYRTDEEDEVETKRSNVWIIVVVVALAIMCCCAFVAATGVVAWLATFPSDWDSFDPGGHSDERVERTVEVGPAPNLEIVNFAGSVRIRAGESGEIRVEATKKVSRHEDLHRLEIDIGERDGSVVIRTRKTGSPNKATVELDIAAPADTRLDVRTGAGTVDVRGLTGDMEVDTGAGTVVLRDTEGRLQVHSGAGTVEVRDASGPAEVGVGAGTIVYEGALEGDSTFSTGMGEIVLRLPETLNARIDLSAGMGGVDVRYDVQGTVSPRKAMGVIGDGSQGSIYAHTGAGNIQMKRR
jgi:DUF4097 and DUF4098 domain-containing protein YvlB